MILVVCFVDCAAVCSHAGARKDGLIVKAVPSRSIVATTGSITLPNDGAADRALGDLLGDELGALLKDGALEPLGRVIGSREELVKREG